jgi:hypothetical protein
MRAKWLVGFAALVLLCGTAATAAPAPGTVDPPAATTPSAEGTEIPVDKATPAKKKVRHHRRWRHSGYYPRPFFLIPPPRYWFRPWPHYRYYRHRWHSRYHRRYWRWW